MYVGDPRTGPITACVSCCALTETSTLWSSTALRSAHASGVDARHAFPSRDGLFRECKASAPNGTNTEWN